MVCADSPKFRLQPAIFVIIFLNRFLKPRIMVLSQPGYPHFLDDGYCPSPLIMASALFAKTKTILIGTSALIFAS